MTSAPNAKSRCASQLTQTLLIKERYYKAGRKVKHLILNEFCMTTGCHRKYAIRLLNGPPPKQRPECPARRRGLSYGHQVLSILPTVWEAAGYPWSVRLKALLPAWLPWIRERFPMSPGIEKQLLSINAQQIDRRLQAKKTQLWRRIYGRTKPGYLLKHHIPVKTITGMSVPRVSVKWTWFRIRVIRAQETLPRR